MSSKSTITLTGDNEHIYHDCNDPVYDGEKWIGDKIFIELDKKHTTIECNDEDALIISLDDPNSEIYKLIQSLKKT